MWLPGAERRDRSAARRGSWRLGGDGRVRWLEDADGFSRECTRLSLSDGPPSIRAVDCVSFIINEAVFKGAQGELGVLGDGAFGVGRISVPCRPHDSGSFQLCLLVPRAGLSGPQEGTRCRVGSVWPVQAEPRAFKARARRAPGLTFQEQAETREFRGYMSVARASGLAL